MTLWNRHGPTAARKHGSLRREARPRGITIDVHSHVVVPEAATLVAPHLDPTKIPAVRFATAETNALNRQQDSERGRRMREYDERLKDMDEMGIDMQLVSPSPAQVYFSLAAEVAVAAARKVNEGIAAFVAGKPDRFVGMGTVPLQDVTAAVAELEHCMGTLGLKGVEILTYASGGASYPTPHSSRSGQKRRRSARS